MKQYRYHRVPRVSNPSSKSAIIRRAPAASASASRWAPCAGAAGHRESFLPLKVVNYGNASLTAAVALRGLQVGTAQGVSVDPVANVTVLAGAPEGCHSLQLPDAIAPGTSASKGAPSFDLALAPWSLTFVRLRLVKAA